MNVNPSAGQADGTGNLQGQAVVAVRLSTWQQTLSDISGLIIACELRAGCLFLLF